MNAFVEHHKHSIEFGYRCFDRLLLNGLPSDTALSQGSITGAFVTTETPEPSTVILVPGAALLEWHLSDLATLGTCCVVQTVTPTRP